MPDREIPRGYILGFDFGLRRIGVAVGQAHTRTATALKTVHSSDRPDWQTISRLVDEWSPERFVVGLPLGADGEETDMSRQAREFGGELSGRFGITVAFCDERLTSREAGEAFSAARERGVAKRKHARQTDSIAARIILENWLQSLPSDRQGGKTGENPIEPSN